MAQHATTLPEQQHTRATGHPRNVSDLEQSYERGSALMNNRILVHVNTQFLCQVVGRHLMSICLHTFGLRWKEMMRKWQLLGFVFSTPIQKKFSTKIGE